MANELLLFLFLVACASCNRVSARFLHPGRRAKDFSGASIRRDLQKGESIIFDPPIPMVSYVSNTCPNDEIGYNSKLASIERLSEGEFCIGGLVPDGVGGQERITYDLLDEITCTPWGIYDRYSACTDATCSVCEPTSVSYYTWEQTKVASLDGFCFTSSYSFDPTSFTDLQTVSFRFGNGADLEGASTYLGLVDSNSCIADGREGASDDNDEEEEDEDDQVEDCQSIPDLLCSREGFTVLCNLFNEWAPELYEPASAGTYTMFAPPDEAFGDIAELFEIIDDEDAGRVFLFHATDGLIMSADLQCSMLMEMIEGGFSRTKCEDGLLIQKGAGNRKNDLLPIITETDIMACNGVIHVLSEVMLPNFIDEF